MTGKLSGSMTMAGMRGHHRPPSRATIDAWAVALSVWSVLLSAVAGALCAIRWRLDSRRFAQWDWRSTTSEGGDRKNSQ